MWMDLDLFQRPLIEVAEVPAMSGTPMAGRLKTQSVVG